MMFETMPSDQSVIEMIKNSTPVFSDEDRELKRAKAELAKLKRLTVDQQLQVKFGALNLYIDFFTEWKIAQAQERKIYFSWEWGKLRFSSIQIYETHDGTTLCPIMNFEEFSAWLIISYNN